MKKNIDEEPHCFHLKYHKTIEKLDSLKTLQNCCVCHPMQAHCRRYSTTILDQKRWRSFTDFWEWWVLPPFRSGSCVDPEAADGPAEGQTKPAAVIPWTDGMQAAFVAAKAAIIGCMRLFHPSPGAEVSFLVDASAKHIGAALQQRAYPSAVWRPLGFFFLKKTRCHSSEIYCFWRWTASLCRRFSAFQTQVGRKKV